MSVAEAAEITMISLDGMSRVFQPIDEEKSNDEHRRTGTR
jgi:hypothetical protein